MHAIQEDAVFAGKYIRSLRHPNSCALSPVMAFCMGSYLSLFVYESQRQIKRIDPDSATQLSEPAQLILTRSRHSLKFFEHTKLGLEGLQSTFWDEIVPAHRDYYVGLLRFRFLKFLATDLGIYRYNGKIISTTHTASFSLGLEAKALANEDLGKFIFDISSEYGSYLAGLGARLDTSATAFPASLDPSLLAREEEDYRADEFYRKIFNGPETPALNATLLLLLGHLNFVNEIVPADRTVASLQYSTFKIRFLAVYQIVRSLEILYTHQAKELSSDSIRVIEYIVRHPVAVQLMSEDIRPLRNTLIHYDIDSRLDLSRIATEDLLGTLLTAALGNHQVEQFLGQLDAFTAEAAQYMNEWIWTLMPDPQSS